MKSKKPTKKEGQTFMKPDIDLDVSKYGKNPFSKTWKFGCLMSSDRFICRELGGFKSHSIYSASAVELLAIRAGQFIPQFIDKGHVAVYNTEAGLKDLMLRRLTNSGQRLLIWVLMHMEPYRDYVILDKEEITKGGKYEQYLSINTMYKAIENLVQESVIAPIGRTSYYWVNMQYFFSGSRGALYPENVVIKKKEDKKWISLSDIEEIKQEFKGKNYDKLRDREKALRGRGLFDVFPEEDDEEF